MDCTVQNIQVKLTGGENVASLQFTDELETPSVLFICVRVELFCLVSFKCSIIHILFLREDSVILPPYVERGMICKQHTLWPE